MEEAGLEALEAEGLEYLLESSACLLFSSNDTVSARTLFFLFRSFTSVSWSSRLTLTIFSSLFKKSISMSFGSFRTEAGSFLVFCLLFGAGTTGKD